MGMKVDILVPVGRLVVEAADNLNNDRMLVIILW